MSEETSDKEEAEEDRLKLQKVLDQNIGEEDTSEGVCLNTTEGPYGYRRSPALIMSVFHTVRSTHNL